MRIAGVRRRGSQVLIFRIRPASSAVDVLSILHDAMDPARHLADDDPHA